MGLNVNNYQSVIAIGNVTNITEDYEVALNKWHFYSDGTVKFGDTSRTPWLNVCKNVRRFVYNSFDVDYNLILSHAKTFDTCECKSFIAIGDVTHITEDYEVVLNNCHFYNDGTVQFGDKSRKPWLEENTTESLLSTFYGSVVSESHVY